MMMMIIMFVVGGKIMGMMKMACIVCRVLDEVLQKLVQLVQEEECVSCRRISCSLVLKSTQ